MKIKRKLRIAYISHFNYGINKYGISQYNEKYLKYMSIKGHQIDFYTLYPFKPNYSLNPLINYVFVKHLPKNPFYYSYYFIKLPFIIDYDKYDIIHTTGGSGIFLKKIDFVTYLHYQKFRISKDYAFFHYLPIKIEIRKANHIIAISRFSKQQCLQKESRNNNISVINLGIDCEIFKSREKIPIRKSLNLPIHEKLMIFIGFLTKRKNPFILVEIARKLRLLNLKAKILVIGNGPLKAPLFNTIKSLKLNSYFLFYENVPQIELYYNASDLALVPSKLEGFGYPYLESAASGIPFIGFPTGVSPQIAREGFGFLAKNEKDFVKKTIEVIQNPIYFNDLGHKYIKNNFSAEKTVNQTERLYFRYLERI